jgi:Protein O-mannosyl-transferase TMEM260-like
MLMNYKLLNRIFAAIVFLISAFVLFSTVQPSVSFWDCGEFIAAGYYLQVPHPPGAPFISILDRIFSMLPIAGNIGLRVNVISVLSSALAIMFLYLIAVKLIENYRKRKPENTWEAVSTYVAAAIGALSFSFSDTFWFNGVEAEVYAMSTFLFAFVAWLMMQWHERADQKDNEKYILMIAYIIGIATGVHLMSVLAIVPVVMVILFRKYVENEKETKKTGYIFLIHVGIILIIAFAMWMSQTSSAPPTQAEYQAYDTKFKMIILGISIVIMGVFWRKIFNKNSFYLPLIIGGVALFAVYPGVVKILPGILADIASNNDFLGAFLFLLILGILGFGVYYATREKKPTLHLIFMSFCFVLLGFTTFSMIIIRSNVNPPMNENQPDTFSELVTYLNREQYGDFPTFKRRFSSDNMHHVTYANYSSDLDFFWRYQMNHMMTRYWLWNYAGRESWVQDAGVDIAPFNKIGNAFSSLLGIHFAGEVKDSLYGIPFLLGLIGIFFHFRRDWKMASVFMITFILMGYLTAFYQNQQNPQPRERDYFYVGAFFVFSIWIAIAVKELTIIVSEKLKNTTFKNAGIAGVLTLGIIFVPINMLKTNYFTHDRSKNWVPWDYSYNLLQSCAPNAVLFTNGDNDTFPLWYLQDVEGVRRDVKIANLSLLNTSWYIKELKNDDPYNVGTLKIRMSDSQIDQIQPIRWNQQNITIAAPKPDSNKTLSDIFQKYEITDSSIMKSGSITFTMKPTLSFGNVNGIRVQDIMVREIVEANAWQRPIYFAVTVSQDGKIGLDNYLKSEGMASRLVPEKTRGGYDFINPDIMKKQIEENPGYSKTYKPGFKFRGLNNPNIFFDDNHKRMTQNYRNVFVALAYYYLNHNEKQLAVQTLDKMQEKLPRETIGMDYPLLYNLANLYYNAGATDNAKKLYSEVETEALQDMEENPSNLTSYFSPYRILLDLYQKEGEYGKLADIWKRIQVYYPDDPSVKANVEKYSQLAKNILPKIDSTKPGGKK